mmetsp:Transcript_30490/g.83568  ORF Transcript_30490/g.83568 Transcript_30490/m.83568 type:complete len:376 (-) Transcript_30490:391-1518(-)
MSFAGRGGRHAAFGNGAPNGFGGGNSFGSGSSKGSKGSRGKGGGRYDNGEWGGSRSRGGSKGNAKGRGVAELLKKQASLTGHTDTVSCLAVAEQRKQFFSGSQDGTVKVWSWESGFQCAHTVNAGAPVECILSFDAWLFAGTAAVSGLSSGVVRVWHMENGFEQTLQGHQGSIFSLAQGGVFLFSGGEDTGVNTWRFETDKFEFITTLKGHIAPIQDMKVSANVLISADRNGQIIFWDLSSGQQSNTIVTGHTKFLTQIWLEDNFLFTSSLDGIVKVWDSTGAKLFEQVVTNQHNQPSGITAMLVTSDGGECSVLVTACDDKALKMWAMPSFDKRGIIASRVGHADCVRCLAKGPGNSFFSGAMDHTIIVWEFVA